MSNNSIRPAFRAGRAALGASIRAAPPSQQSRCFSASTPRPAGNVITFSKTSNAELDNLLHEMQQKIILPSVLPLHQRKKIFRERYKEKLELEPIEIEIDGKRIKFRYLDFRKGEVPTTRKIFFQALENMKTKEDWQKLPKLLEALHHNARRKFEVSDWPKIVRKAGASGNLGPVIEAVKRPERTGFKLDMSEKVQEIMSWIVWEAAEAGWTVSSLNTALKSAERVLEALNGEGHELHTKDKERAELIGGRFPLRRDPQVLATPLFLAAMLAVKHGKTEYADKMRRYAQVIVEQWPEGKGLLDLHPHEAYVDVEGMHYMMEKNKFTIVASPILKGFDLAIEGLSSDLASQIKLRRDPLAVEVEDALGAEKSQNGRGKYLYEKCFLEPSKAQKKTGAKAQAKEEAEGATAA
ncbi:hypothetical protein KVR01_008777 [Diaporthe batatas]|uniref:uncharacterized protein n=1 Tax=Diaporthe batatas TaxID=748121 RepID=UPI001D04A545|nr:uncharacterized protein KVR01_008777 [Diaporthe batatas]KAG8161790.1 hypothetical protein KVR01_008777 [Diaporthe batatas]